MVTLRRKFLLMAGAWPLGSPLLAQGQPTLQIRWLGHTSFLFTSREGRILVNPFRSVACTQGYRTPRETADLVLMSSRLFDEGAIDVVPGNPRVLYQPGAYDIEGLKLQGIRTFHDKKQGLQFGINVVWRWTQGGINLVHLGGIAAPLTPEERILIGQPDIAFVPVGGGQKAFDAALALETVKALNPRLVVPTHYRTPGAAESCDLSPVEPFLAEFPKEAQKIYPGPEISLSPLQIPKTPLQIRVFTYTGLANTPKRS